MKYLFVICMPLLILFSACKKDAELIVISDNKVQPDVAVPLIFRENYINKTYIGLLGRKPTSAEEQTALVLLDRDNASKADRIAVLETVFVQPEFFYRMYDVAKAEMIANVDTLKVRFDILILTTYLDSPQFEPFYPIIRQELSKLGNLLTAPYQLKNGQIDRVELHSRMCYNPYYDEVNMGSRNFVLAMFEYFLGRAATEAEAEAAVVMVDGFGSVIFQKDGYSKTDFIEIFLHSDDYVEGQVKGIYQDFILRIPTSVEMAAGVAAYKKNDSYTDLLKSILSKDEYLK